MIVKTNLFKPKLLFLNKQHYFPNNESYIFTKNISEIKNTPLSYLLLVRELFSH